MPFGQLLSEQLFQLLGGGPARQLELEDFVERLDAEAERRGEREDG
jgi:hypothetical protein